jgi:hypothetical protein
MLTYQLLYSLNITAMYAQFLLKSTEDIYQGIYDELINDQDINIPNNIDIQKVLKLIIVDCKLTVWDFLHLGIEDLKSFRGVGNKILYQLLDIQRIIVIAYGDIYKDVKFA